MHKEELEKLMQERLSSYELEPEDGLEEGIFSALAKAQKRLMVKKIALAIATLVFLGTGTFLTSTERGPSESKLAQNDKDARAVSPEDELVNADVDKSEGKSPVDAEPAVELPIEQNSRKPAHAVERNSKIPPTTESMESPAGRREEVPGIRTSHFAPPLEQTLNGKIKINAPNWFQGWQARPVVGGFSFGLTVPHLIFNFRPEPAEEIVIVPDKERKWAVYTEMMPFFNYTYFEVDKTDDLLVTDLQRQPALSFGRIGWRAEAGIEYDLSPRLRLQTGLMVYSRKQEAVLITSAVDTVVAEQIADRHMMNPVFSEDTVRMSVDLFNVGWIIGLQYKIADGHLKQWIGLSAEMHKGLKRHVAFENQVTGKHPSAYYTFANLYYRAEYQWKPRLILFAQPTFNYNLYISEKLQAPVNVRPFGLGASFGVRWRM